MISPNHPCLARRIAGLRRILLLAAVCCLLPAFLSHTTPMQAEAATLPVTAKQVRVGLANSLHTAELRCGNGFTIGVSDRDGRGFETLFSLGNTALRVRMNGDGSLSLTDGASGQTLYTHTSQRPLALRGAGGQPVTMDDREYPGFMEITPFDGGLRVVNVVELETYVKCVMGIEIGTAHPKETRRAFSVMIRTVPMSTTKHASKGYDVCGTNCCQVYRGNFRRDPENDLIVDSTKGEYITYEGEPIKCF